MRLPVEYAGLDAHRILSFRGEEGREGGELWQGGVEAAANAALHGFNVVVLCAEEAQFTRPEEAALLEGLEVIRFPGDDARLDAGHMHGHVERAKEIAKKVAGCVRDRKRVLVTCFCGWNRSGLVTALATRILTRRPGKQIVARIRAKRPNALSNASFRAYVEALP